MEAVHPSHYNAQGFSHVSEMPPAGVEHKMGEVLTAPEVQTATLNAVQKLNLFSTWAVPTGIVSMSDSLVGESVAVDFSDLDMTGALTS